MRLGVVVGNVFLYMRLMKIKTRKCDDGLWGNVMSDSTCSPKENLGKLVVAWKHGHKWLDSHTCDRCTVTQVMEE